MKITTSIVFFVLSSLFINLSHSQNFYLDSGSVTLFGRVYFTDFTLSGSAIVYVVPYNETIPGSGTLEIWANSIRIDSSAQILAKGAGYATPTCLDGTGPSEYPLSGGRGGCSVRDSGGGGAHFGAGGPGTKDCARAGSSPCIFPADYEENCGGALNGTICNNHTSCWTYQGTNLVGGLNWTHNIYSSLGMGAAGGDKGCRDADTTTNSKGVGGRGGGKIVLNSTGTLEIYGKVNAQGNRGCADGNDSGGGGAGGSIVLLAGGQLLVSGTTIVTVEGGKGGDSQYKSDPECLGTQMGGACDDCGGGGGGGFIFVRGASGNYRSYRDVFKANGAIGGSCTVCNLKAEGEYGWVQFDSDGEICNGVDDTFDGVVDEGCGSHPSPSPSGISASQNPSSSVQPPTDSPSSHSGGLAAWAIVMIVCLLVGLAAGLGVALLVWIRMKRKMTDTIYVHLADDNANEGEIPLNFPADD